MILFVPYEASGIEKPESVDLIRPSAFLGGIKLVTHLQVVQHNCNELACPFFLINCQLLNGGSLAIRARKKTEDLEKNVQIYEPVTIRTFSIGILW